MNFLKRLFTYGVKINNIITEIDDPEQWLKQTVIDMEESLSQCRQMVARNIAETKRTEQRYQKDLDEARRWEERGKLAMNKNDSGLAREAFDRQKSFQDNADSTKITLEQQKLIVEKLKKLLIMMDTKVSEINIKKNAFVARSRIIESLEEIRHFATFDQTTIQEILNQLAMDLETELEDKKLEQNNNREN